ncbi:MAG: hypothetical protein IMW89_21530 [Ktedonobacteraceae bacterium]|nr:hypothetical protein [Ktedonobacteraceae bacterium]
MQLFVTASEALRPKVTPVRNRPASADSAWNGNRNCAHWRPRGPYVQDEQGVTRSWIERGMNQVLLF